MAYERRDTRMGDMVDAQTASLRQAPSVPPDCQPESATALEKLRDPTFQRVLFKRINVWMLLMWRLEADGLVPSSGA
jgi:hypothetical protein